MLRASKIHRNELSTSRWSQGQFELFGQVDFYGDHTYFLLDEEVCDAEACGSSLIYEISVAASRMVAASSPPPTLYALLPTVLTGLRRRLITPVTSIWICSGDGKPRSPSFWRVHTELLTFLVGAGDVSLGDEVPQTHVWSEAATS